MSTANVLEPTGEFHFPVPARLPPVDFAREKALAKSENLVLIESDGIPMESLWHVHCMHLLIEQINCHHQGRSDYFVAGNMFVYYSVTQARNLDFRGPDFLYVGNTHHEPIRRYWVVWEEERTPDVVIELASPSTRKEDYGAKFAIYRDRLKVGNYFIYDPETRVLDGWRLQGVDYVPIPRGPNGRLFSDKLGLDLGQWEGKYATYEATWLRWFTLDGNVVPLFAEAEKQLAEIEKRRADAEKQNADSERQKADAEKQKADAERLKADAERQKADAERQRADAAAAENARLRELLSKLQPGSTNGSAPH
jgi:Uma2 family endonuclease